MGSMQHVEIDFSGKCICQVDSLKSFQVKEWNHLKHIFLFGEQLYRC